MSARRDQYFMRMCEAAASNCRCPARQLGAVIATSDHYVVSTGYNGPPAGFPNPGTERFKEIAEEVSSVKPNWALSECTRLAVGVASGKQLGLCPCAHAERNAISAAARCGVATNGCILYLSGHVLPCLDCAYSIVNAGIAEVVSKTMKVYPQDFLTGDVILRESGILVRQAEVE